MANIGQRLKELRGTTPRNEVAQAWGVSLSAVQMYEAGQRIPRDEIKIRIANYYGVSVESLFFERKVHET